MGIIIRNRKCYTGKVKKEKTPDKWETIRLPYTVPFDMMGRVLGVVTATGVYTYYLVVNGAVAGYAFSGYATINYQTTHYFKLHKGDIISSVYAATNLSNITLQAEKIT